MRKAANSVVDFFKWLANNKKFGQAVVSLAAIPPEAALISSSIIVLVMEVMENFFESASDDDRYLAVLSAWLPFIVLGSIFQYYYVGNQGLKNYSHLSTIAKEKIQFSLNQGESAFVSSGEEVDEETLITTARQLHTTQTGYIPLLAAMIWFVPLALDGFFTGDFGMPRFDNFKIGSEVLAISMGVVLGALKGGKYLITDVEKYWQHLQVRNPLLKDLNQHVLAKPFYEHSSYVLKFFREIYGPGIGLVHLRALYIVAHDIHLAVPLGAAIPAHVTFLLLAPFVYSLAVRYTEEYEIRAALENVKSRGIDIDANSPWLSAKRPSLRFFGRVVHGITFTELLRKLCCGNEIMFRLACTAINTLGLGSIYRFATKDVLESRVGDFLFHGKANILEVKIAAQFLGYLGGFGQTAGRHKVIDHHIQTVEELEEVMSESTPLLQ